MGTGYGGNLDWLGKWLRLSFGLPTNSREWRNWQTHQLEGLAVAIPCRFKSCLAHFFLTGSRWRLG